MANIYALWPWNAVDAGRMARARKIKLISIVESKHSLKAQCVGSSGELYHVSLQECTCVDFSRSGKNQPCKHMLALAYQRGIINEAGLTEDQQSKKHIRELAIKVAIASAYYHLYNKQIMSDNDYETLKYELWDDACTLIAEEDILSESLIHPYTDSAIKLLEMPLNEYIDKFTSVIDTDTDTFTHILTGEV